MTESSWTSRLPFGMLRQMARDFGGVEFHSSGRWCIRIKIDGKTYRSFSAPMGRRWISYRSRETAEDVLDEIRAELRRGTEPVAALAPYLTRARLHSIETWWRKYGEWLDDRAANGQITKTRARLDGLPDPVRRIGISSGLFWHDR